MSLFEETKFIMNKYGIRADKNLGQNFLVDDEVVNGIVDASYVNENDLIIEIGPGLGTLTSKLLERAGKVIAIELDKRVLEILHDRFLLYKNFELINNDVLKVDLKKVIEDNLNDSIRSAKVVANLPYYITTPIIMKLLEEKLPLDSITIMVQKEVAERLISIPGQDKDIGAITHSIYYYTDSKIVLNVPNSSFIPAPKVDSAVIKMDILKTPRVQVENEVDLFKLIKCAFSQKRKTLINALTNTGYASKEAIEKALLDIGLDLKIRPENLKLEEYVELYNKLK